MEENFTSAEGVTRYLRAKNTTPESAVRTARKLLNSEFSLYLPNAAIFVFELVCDRVSELTGKNFMKWKYCPEIWTLFADVWDSLGADSLDREVRAKAFRRVKLVQVAAAVLDEASQNIGEVKVTGTKKGKSKKPTEEPKNTNSPLLLTQMFSCVRTLSTSGYIEVDEFSAIGLVKSYSNLLLKYAPTSLVEFPIDSWTALICNIYDLPHQSVMYKPSKKSMSRYFTEVLPIHLTLFSNHKAAIPAHTYKSLHAIFSSILFDLERSTLPAHIETTVKDAPAYLDREGIAFLFQEVITNMASTDIAACEAVYKKLTAERYAAMAEELITVLSNVNKTLSSTFFAELYEKEVTHKSPNWMLLSHLLQLDPELTLSKWKDVVEGSRDMHADFVTVAENVASGFVRARDFPVFVSEVYPFALTVSDAWSSHEVLSKIVPKVNEMSGNQISRLIKQFLDSQSLKPLSLLVQGLLMCPLSKQTVSKKLFEDYAFCHKGWSEIAFYVICVYGESILDTQPEIVEKVLDSGVPSSTTDFDLILRIAELKGTSENIHSKSLLKYVQSMDKAHLLPFMERWVVILSLFPDSYYDWFKKAFKKLDHKDVLHFVKSRQALLCEMPEFLTGLSKYLLKHRPACTHELLSIFPPSVFRKFFGEFLPLLTEEALKKPENLEVRGLLRHIMQEPGLGSGLGKDFDTLIELLASTTEATLSDTLAIAEAVWGAHITSIKSDQSKKYVEGATERLHKSSKKPKKADAAMLRVVLSSESAKSLNHFEQMLENYVAHICAAITLENIQLQLSALSELPNLTTKAKALIKAAAKKFGGEKLSPQCQAQLFAMVAKSSGPDDRRFIAALFVGLRQIAESEKPKDELDETLEDQNAEDSRSSLMASLQNYSKHLPADDYADLFAHCIKSLRDAPSAYVHSLVDACTILVPFVKIESEAVHARLMVAFISAFSERSKDITDAAVTLSFVTAITDSLSQNSWVFKQYTVELVLSTAHMLAYAPDYGKTSERIYIAVVRLVSFVVLFHRFRLSNRYHLIIKILSDLMVPLSNKGVLRKSTAAAAAYARLVTSFCEPQTHVSSKDADALTSRTALYRKAIRKHAHILLVNYISVRLQYTFSGDVSEQLMSGVYSVFSLLSKTELSLANKCLDTSGRAYYQTLYGTYKEHGKWRE